MGVRRVDLHTMVWPQEDSLSRYQNADVIDWVVEHCDLADLRDWLSGRGIDIKAEMYKVTMDGGRYIRCVIYADMAAEDNMLMRLTFGMWTGSESRSI